MIKKYYKRTYHNGAHLVTKASTDMGKLIAANEIWGIPRKDGVVRGPPVEEITELEYREIRDQNREEEE
jgi:hypothetical protein|tara:strand:+ start:76 stop:282 length:207 start_codon:yes stop_codon:yes gene_type:complete